jgi:hypothetical protein
MAVQVKIKKVKPREVKQPARPGQKVRDPYFYLLTD